MSALRWEEQDCWPGSAAPPPPPVRGAFMVHTGDDDAARGIVLGVAASLLGFWLPLTAIVTLARRRRRSR